MQGMRCSYIVRGGVLPTNLLLPPVPLQYALQCCVTQPVYLIQLFKPNATCFFSSQKIARLSPVEPHLLVNLTAFLNQGAFPLEKYETLL